MFIIVYSVGAKACIWGLGLNSGFFILNGVTWATQLLWVCFLKCWLEILRAGVRVKWLQACKEISPGWRPSGKTRSIEYDALPCAAAAAAAKSLQSCLTLWDPIDGSPPGAPIPGILQARILECVAISFSNAWKWKVKVKSLSHVWLLATPWTAAYQAPPSIGFSRRKYWSGVPSPSPLPLALSCINILNPYKAPQK